MKKFPLNDPRQVPGLLTAVSALFISLRNQNRRLERELAKEKEEKRVALCLAAERLTHVVRLKELLESEGKSSGLDPMSEIKRVVAGVCGVPEGVLSNLEKGSKQLSQTWPRQLAMYLCLKYRLAATQNIAAAFNRKNHGTVLHAKKAVLAEIEISKERRIQHDTCVKQIEESMNLRSTAAGGS